MVKKDVELLVGVLALLGIVYGLVLVTDVLFAGGIGVAATALGVGLACIMLSITMVVSVMVLDRVDQT